MAIYHTVYIPTRFKSAESLKKAYPGAECEKRNGIFYRSFLSVAMRGKVKNFILANVTGVATCDKNFNGYGYKDHFHDYFLKSAKAAQQLQLMLEEKKTKDKKTVKTEAEVIKVWAKRLVSLLKGNPLFDSLTLSEAEEIAREKLVYKAGRISEMEDRQYERYSYSREKLITQMKRENPLRRIANVEHAYAIIEASRRHGLTDYEDLLDSYKSLAKTGQIAREDVREMARRNARGYAHVCDEAGAAPAFMEGLKKEAFSEN